MKKLFILLIIAVSGLTGSAQPPQKMSYQCVVRDKDGLLLTKQLVGMRSTILQGTDLQLVVYQETYNFTATNANGLLTVEIGSGKPTIVSGSFSSIPWSSGPFFLQTEIDPTGGTNYTIIGKSQILSVPYALYAEKSGTVTETDPVFGTSVARGITWSNMSNWNTSYSWGDHAIAGYAPNIHEHTANDISSGTLAVARGGTGLGLYTAGNFLRAGGATTIEQRTPAQVLSDIGAVGISGDQTVGGTKSFAGLTNINNLNVLASISVNFNTIRNVATPISNQDAATKAYVDLAEAAAKKYVDDVLKSTNLFSGNFAGIVTDIDGNIYPTVTIGTQTWMAKNLAVRNYSNGNAITAAQSADIWLTINTGGYCRYNNSESIEKTYGLLYNWFAVVDNRNICPAGWHVPTNLEFSTLFDYLAGYDVAGGKLKEAGFGHWDSPNEGATNETGFTALPGGDRWSTDGTFASIRFYGYWWTSETYPTLKTMSYTTSSVSNHSGLEQKRSGLSVRCIKD